MKISAIEIFILDAGYLSSKIVRDRAASPMTRYPRFAATRSSWLWPTDKVVTVVHGDNGQEGVSVTNGGEVAATIAARLASLIRGEPADDPRQLWEMMMRAISLWDRSGFAGMALAALDIAIWDLCARSAGKPLLDFLGGARSRDLPVYVTTGQPARFAGKGYSGVKMPALFGPEMGAKGIELTCEQVGEARKLLGQDVDISLDCFLGWDAAFTEACIDRLGPYRIRWIEDPLLVNDIDGFRRLAASSHRFSLGNFCFSLAEVRQFVELGVVDTLQPDIAWCGGITETLRIAEFAGRAGIPLIFHNTTEQPWALALSFALPEVGEIEHVDRGEGSSLGNLFDGQVAPADGRFHAADVPACNALTARARASLRLHGSV